MDDCWIPPLVPVEAVVDLQDEPRWNARAAWRRQHQPILEGDAADAQAKMLNGILQGARAHHLEIDEQNLGTISHGPGGAKLTAELKLKGALEPLCRWLAALQKHGEGMSRDRCAARAGGSVWKFRAARAIFG